MIKQLLQFLIALLLVFFVSYFAHSNLLNATEVVLSYSLLKIYLFHLFASAIILLLVTLVYYKLPNQTGYVYLASVFLKLGFSVLIFKSSVFTDVDLSKIERISLVIPLFIFLIVEVIAVSKILNSK